MKRIAAVFADFAESFLGGPSPLLTPIGGAPLLAHTLRRMVQLRDEVDALLLAVNPRDERAAADLLHDLGLAGVTLAPIDTAPRPRRRLIRAARIWGLASWRGTPLGTTYFDEFVEPTAVAQVLNHAAADAALCVDGRQPLFDVEIARQMLAHHASQPDEARFVFTQAPPGLAGVILDRQVTAELCEQEWPLGLILSYRPELPRTDPITRPMCCRIDPVIAMTAARLTGDTVRARELISELLAALGADVSAVPICAWLRDHPAVGRFTSPTDVEIELTTRDPLPDSTVRLRGDRVPAREIADVAVIERALARLDHADERLVLLGGCGDPLQHVAFPDVCRRIRAAGVLGLGVVTPLVDLSDAALAALFDSPVDLIEVTIDAHSAATYQRVHRRDAYATVLTNIERIEAERRRRQSPQPLIVPSLTRCSKTAPELEAFFDDWIRRSGTAVIRGYDDAGGALGPDSLLALVPPVRRPCRHLSANRLVLLGDGRASACGRDSRGTLTVGNWLETPLSEIWQGQELQHLRDRHAAGRWGEIPACGACRGWHTA